MLQLHPYQFEGAGFLAERSRGYLADEPGLGKTAQAICAADWLELQTGVVICPAFLRTNWTREFATCTPAYYRWEQLMFTRLMKKGWGRRKPTSVRLTVDA